MVIKKTHSKISESCLSTCAASAGLKIISVIGFPGTLDMTNAFKYHGGYLS